MNFEGSMLVFGRISTSEPHDMSRIRVKLPRATTPNSLQAPGLKRGLPGPLSAFTRPKIQGLSSKMVIMSLRSLRKRQEIHLSALFWPPTTS